jgi:hypothetical protein
MCIEPLRAGGTSPITEDRKTDLMKFYRVAVGAPDDDARSRVVRSPMQPSSILPWLSMTRISPGLAVPIASRKISTLP